MLHVSDQLLLADVQKAVGYVVVVLLLVLIWFWPGNRQPTQPPP